MDELKEDSRNLRTDLKGKSVRDVIAELDQNRAKMQIAIENWDHDFNMGSIVRTANAFNVSAVHIIGRRRWNSRGAMMTDTYLHVYHHFTVAEFGAWARRDEELRQALRSTSINEVRRGEERLDELAPILHVTREISEHSPQIPVIGIDCLDGVSTPIENETLPKECVLLFGSEGSGLSHEAQDLALESSGQLLHITQYGSTRSMNVGHAAAVTMFKWSLDHRPPSS
jgi:tRNA G18 (ribose-2'-O)-methylase SpoU